MSAVDNKPPFNYQAQAELARKAQRDLKNFTADALRKVYDNPSRDTLREWGNFQSTPQYQDLLEIYWAAIDAACPPDFDDDLTKLPVHSDRKALETAVAFLEADPFFFRSGYIKEKLLRYVRGYQLPTDYVRRLQRVILNVIDNHYCREFSEYRRLAHRIDSDELRSELQSRTQSEDYHIRNRAKWVLNWLETRAGSSTKNDL